jgi:hypothetical protein
LTLAEAAERVGRSERSVRRWRQLGMVRFCLGRVREDDLLEADRAARARLSPARAGGGMTAEKARRLLAELTRAVRAGLLDPALVRDYAFGLVDAIVADCPRNAPPGR